MAIFCTPLLFSYIPHVLALKDILMSLYRKVEYLKKVGNRQEVAKYQNADQELIDSLEKYAPRVPFSQWKEKVSVVQKNISISSVSHNYD